MIRYDFRKTKNPTWIRISYYTEVNITYHYVSVQKAELKKFISYISLQMNSARDGF